MNFRKFTVAFVAVLVLLVPYTCATVAGTGTTVVTLEVPAAYTVSVTCGANGGFTDGETVYTSDTVFTVQRETGLTLTIMPAPGYCASVTASTDKGVTLSGNTLTFGDSLKAISVALTFAQREDASITLEKDEALLLPGLRTALNPAFTTGEAFSEAMTATSSNESVATVDADGIVTAISAGTAQITVTDHEFTATCTVTVAAPQKLGLPAGLKTLSEEAMIGNTAIECAVFDKDVTAIGDRAFKDCANLRYVVIPASEVTFGEDCFEGCAEDFTIFAPKDSAAQSYAQQQGFNFEAIVP